VADSIRAPFAQHHAVVRLHAPVETVADRLPASAGVLEAVDDQTCLLRTVTESLEWLALFVGVLGVDFDVVEPPALADCVRGIAERCARATSGGAR
jgi:predicted DNA-binding transcriptional regulator YafY